MIMEEPGALLTADESDEYRLTFCATSAKGSPEKARALMTFRCFSEDKFLGIIAWFGQHQHYWRDWCRIAKEKGVDAFCHHLVEVQERTGRDRFGNADMFAETVMGAYAKAIGDKGIHIALELATQHLKIIQHAFKSKGHRDAFLRSMAENPKNGSVELAMLGLMEGRAALARKLDERAEIARAEIRVRPQRHHR